MLKIGLYSTLTTAIRNIIFKIQVSMHFVRKFFLFVKKEKKNKSK